MPNETGIVPFWKGYDRKSGLRFAQMAEDLGYHSIWLPEAWAYEQFQLLTEIAVHTKRIKLATGITNIFSRSAALLAMTAATLDEISEGRVILGLGTSGKKVIENLHGQKFEKPLTRVRETVGIVNALLAGKRLTPDMSSFFEARNFKLEMTPLRPHIPIHIASLNDKAIIQTGEIADGWMPTFWPYKHFGDAIALLEQGAKKAGRDVSEIEVSPFVTVIPFDDVNFARSMVKPLVSFYIGGMGDYYHNMFCRFGFKENADHVLATYNGPDRASASDAVSDELIDAIAICGPTQHCQEKLAEWRTHGLGTAILGLPTSAPPEFTEQFLKDLAPSR